MIGKTKQAIFAVVVIAALTFGAVTMTVQDVDASSHWNEIDCSQKKSLDSKGRCVGTSGPDRIRGTPGDDHILGYGGNDIIFGYGGNDQIKGGLGDDEIYGGEDVDSIKGEEDNDEIHGGPGDDFLEGNLGKDKIYGDSGKDNLWGHDGEDVIHGGSGDDKIHGGNGNDTLVAGDNHHDDPENNPNLYDVDQIWCDNSWGGSDTKYSNNLVYYTYGIDIVKDCKNDEHLWNDNG